MRELIEKLKRTVSGFWGTEEGKKELRKIYEHNKGVKTRSIRFKKLYDEEYEKLRSEFFMIGPKAAHGSWVGGTRVQARRMARKLAREKMRKAA